MAAQEKLISNTGSDLDALIHSLEYENQQYVKMIEKENQRNEYLESQEEEKQRHIAELQTQVASLEADTKNNHRQLVHNKNTLESLKKSKCVLQAHKDALFKHLDTLQFENNEQQHEFEDTVQMYEKTWTDYEAQYKSLALYQKLQEEEQRLAQFQAEQHRWQQKKNELQIKIKAVQDELDFRGWHRFCIKIAEKRVMIGRKKEELLAAVREKENLQAKLKEIREKNTSVSVTPSESTQDMETDSSIVEISEKEEIEDDVTEKDHTLVGGDGGDTRGVEAENQNLCPEEQASNGIETASQDFSNNQTFTIQGSSNTQVPADVSLSNINTDVADEKMEEDRSEIQENRFPDHVDGIVTLTLTSPVVTGPKSVTRKPFQQLQLTSTPRTTQQPPTLTVPKIKMGVQQRYNSRLQVPVPQNSHLPRKVVPDTSGQQSGSAAVSRNRPKPPRLSVPLLSIPRPSLPPASFPHIPTVRSAVSSILSGAKSFGEKLPKPTAPRIALPRTPLQAPPPSPVLVSQFPRPMDMSKSKDEMSQSEQFKATSSAPSAALPAQARDQVQRRGERPSPSAPGGSVWDLPASVSHCPGHERPSASQMTMSVSQQNTFQNGSEVPPEPATPAAGDAPPAQLTGKTSSPRANQEEMQKDSTKMISQDEEMESDTDSKGLSDPLSSSQPSEGWMSQGLNNPFSPFSLDKHKQKLLEINEESSDCFNFEQRHLFRTSDKEVDNTTHSTTSASSIFNMAFVNSPSVPQEPPVVPLFRNVISPDCSAPPGPAKPPPPNRDSERGGSFFSFESMDTSEHSGGLSLLSMFDNGCKEPEPEPTFAFSFGANSADSGNGSGFSFSFGEGDGGGMRKPSGSVFSLF